MILIIICMLLFPRNREIAAKKSVTKNKKGEIGYFCVFGIEDQADFKQCIGRIILEYSLK